MIYSCTITVTHKEIDDLHHVNNLIYLGWILQVAKKHWKLTVSDDLQKKYTWVVLSHYIEYKHPAFESDQLVIDTWVERYTSTSCERHTTIKNKQSDKILVIAVTKWCPISRKTSKPTRIIPELVDPFLRG